MPGLHGVEQGRLARPYLGVAERAAVLAHMDRRGCVCWHAWLLHPTAGIVKRGLPRTVSNGSDVTCELLHTFSR